MSRQIAQPSGHYELAPDEALALVLIKRFIPLRRTAKLSDAGGPERANLQATRSLGPDTIEPGGRHLAGVTKRKHFASAID
jgi:hypothetical protein